MRDWSLQPSSASQAGDPVSLTLAADMRLCQPDFSNDQIWELEIGAGEPASLAVHTTYGLRARSMRLFYRFSESGRSVTSPDDFFRRPRLRRFYPNFLWLDFLPFEGLEAAAEYWVPESHALAGRLSLSNRASAVRSVDLELCGTLKPLEGRKPLVFAQQQMINILAGRTGGLAPVLFMTGGAEAGRGPHPSLAINLRFEPGQTHTLTWCIAGEAEPAASFELARRMASSAWDAERARIELVDSSDVLDIRTGNPDWDAALAAAQKSARGLFFPTSAHLPRPSFVGARQPDNGYSRSGAGLDHALQWSGQGPLETYYLASLLPTAPDLKRGLLENYLSVQAADGSIDARPGMAGQRAQFAAAPLLASPAWDYFQDTQDETFLAEVFPKLLAFFEAWFLPARDLDHDGIPAWDHLLQTGFEDHPLFDVWHPWSQGLGISQVFNPELEAMLYREATALILMAEKLAQASELGRLHGHAALLRSSVEAAWNATLSLYCYRDRITGQCSPGKLIGRLKGPGEMRPKKAVFKEAVRLVIDVRSQNPTAPVPVIEIAGSGAEIREGKGVELVEHMADDQFQRRGTGWVAVSGKAYCRVSRIMIQGLEETDTVTVRSLDSSVQDVTLFTALWAHLPAAERARAMIENSLMNSERFNGAFGVRAFVLPSPRPSSKARGSRDEAEATAMSVHLPWNQIVGEGLLAYGFRTEAARLTEHLMSAVIQSLKQNHAFYERYHAETGSGLGERGALTGFAPVGLFLQTLGVSVLSRTRVRLEGKNPFSWPVTIFYRGLKLVRGLEETEVVFPNGQTSIVSDPEACEISM